MNRLSLVRNALLRELGSETRLHFVNTRLILTVDVNLNAPDPGSDNDPIKVERALTALQKMGFLKGVEVRRGT